MKDCHLCGTTENQETMDCTIYGDAICLDCQSSEDEGVWHERCDFINNAFFEKWMKELT